MRSCCRLCCAGLRGCEMYCVLIAGLPATGKTTLSEYLSRRLDLPVISKDRIKELLYDTVGFAGRQEKVRLGVAAMDILYYMARQLMERNLPFILENNFEDVSRPGLAALLEEFSYQPVTVMLTGDYLTLYNRFLLRNGSPERHRGHVVNSRYPETNPGEETGYLSYDDFVSGFTARGMDRFSVGGFRIEVDTTDFSKVDLESIAERIQRFTE